VDRVNATRIHIRAKTHPLTRRIRRSHIALSWYKRLHSLQDSIDPDVDIIQSLTEFGLKDLYTIF
jgi:hypothetical protein